MIGGTVNDLINGVFEIVGGILCWFNVRKLVHDRTVRGIYWPVQAFFAVWGWWSLYYYPSLAQWASFTGGVILALGNTAWIVLALRYNRLDKSKIPDYHYS